MGILSQEDIRNLHAAVMSAHLMDSRPVLLGGIPPTVVGALPNADTASARILSDLLALNDFATLTDGTVPLMIWLENAMALTALRKESTVFNRALEHCRMASIGLQSNDSRPSDADAPFLVPFLRNKHFVGRADELRELHALLQRGGPVGVEPAALTGMGGIGKTQLAVEYAYAYRASYSDGVYWLNAAGSNWYTEVAKLATRVGLSAGDVPESLIYFRLAEVLATHLKARPNALLILDNVDDPRDLLGDAAAGFIPSTLGCRVLFTSRRRFGDLPFLGVEVRVLPEEAALQLLLSNRAENIHSADDDEGNDIRTAQNICNWLGCLPLALAIAAAYLGRHPEVQLHDYHARIRAEGALPTVDKSGIQAKDLPTKHMAAVKATLRLQWREVKDPHARLTLQTAALLGEAAEIPLARLSLLTGLPMQSATGRPAALLSALRELFAWSLVEELTERAVRLHPLVREFALQVTPDMRALADESAQRLSTTFADMLRLNAEVCQRGIDEVLDDLRIVSTQLKCADGVVAAIRRLYGVLDVEAHRLREWDARTEPGFLLQQIRNRCIEHCDDDSIARAELALDTVGWASLRPRFPFGHESPELVRTLLGHKAGVNAVAVSKDGRLVISAADDKSVMVWDNTTGKLLKTLEGHGDWVKDVCVSADGALVVSASMDRTLKLWDVRSGSLLKTLGRHSGGLSAVALTPDGSLARVLRIMGRTRHQCRGMGRRYRL